jgi:hypothetical protein
VPAPSWQEMRNRATRFTLRWRDESRERAEKDSFWNEFFAVFDIDRRRVAVFEHLSSRHSTGGRGFMDVFWPGYVAAQHKSSGSDLDKALDQALDYLPTIPPGHLPRLVGVSDFARFRVRNQLTGEEIEFPSTNLGAWVRIAISAVGMADALHWTGQTGVDVELAPHGLQRFDDLSPHGRSWRLLPTHAPSRAPSRLRADADRGRWGPGNGRERVTR